MRLENVHDAYNCDQGETMSKEQTITIGKFSFSYDFCAEGQVYITDDKGGEAGAFSVPEFEKEVEKFFNDKF